MKIFSNIKGDLYGGINAGVVALPVALAFGAAAGMDPINGIYGAIFLGLIAALFGGTQTLISNPTGPMAVVTALIVATEIKSTQVVDKLSGAVLESGTLEKAMPAIITIFVLAGLIQIIFGVLKLGKYVAYIPYPVISGFMSGIGMIIIILQIPKFLGSGAESKVIGILGDIPNMIMSINPVNILLAIATVAIIYLFPKITKVVPSTLVALVAVTAVSWGFGLDKEFGIQIIESKTVIAAKLPSPRLELFTGFNFSMLGGAILPALSLAGLGMIDSLLTSVVADNLTKTKHKPNLELIGQGVGNMVSGIFGGIPGAGTTPATVLNINSGGRTQLSGIFHALILFGILMLGGPVAGKIPLAVLSGVLVTVGISVLDRNVLNDIKYVPKNDNFIMFAVLGLTVFYDLLYAVGIGLIIAALYFMKKMADVVERETSNKRVDKIVTNIIGAFERSDDFGEKVEIITLNGPLFFGFASRFQNKIDSISADLSAVVFDFSHVHHMDQSGVYTFKEACKTLKEKEINVCLCDMHWRQRAMMEGITMIPEIIEERFIFENIEDAIQWLNEPGHLDNNFALDGDLYIPSVFTPNGDGVNDDWEIRNIDQYPNCHVVVYTKTNIMLFESNDGYKTRWEGFNMRGKVVPDGKYNYEIDLHGDKKDVRMGTVSIFR